MADAGFREVATGSSPHRGPFSLIRHRCPNANCERFTSWLENNGLLVQGLGPGTALQMVAFQPLQGSLCRNLTVQRHILVAETDEELGDLTMSLIPSSEPQLSAHHALQQACQHWNALHPDLPVLLGSKLLQCKRIEARLPQGVFIAFGTKRKGCLYQASSPGWSQAQPVRIRSIGKSLACMVVLRLQEQGCLSLADRVSQHLSSWDRPDKQHITLGQVLNHVSGLQAVPDSHPALTRSDINLKQSAAMLAELPVVAPVREKFVYWGGGYQVLGAVVEHVTGAPWSKVFDELIAGPLNMRHTKFMDSSNSGPNPSNPTIGMACVSTAADMLQYLAMLVHGGQAVGADELLSPHATTAGEPPSPTTTHFNGNHSNSRSGSLISADTFQLLLSDQAPGADPSGCPMSSRLMQPQHGAHLYLAGLRDTGLIPPELCEAAKAQAVDIHYSLGGWPNSHAVTGHKNFTSLGYFNSVLHIAGADTGVQHEVRNLQHVSCSLGDSPGSVNSLLLCIAADDSKPVVVNATTGFWQGPRVFISRVSY